MLVELQLYMELHYQPDTLTQEASDARIADVRIDTCGIDLERRRWLLLSKSNLGDSRGADRNIVQRPLYVLCTSTVWLAGALLEEFFDL